MQAAGYAVSDQYSGFRSCDTQPELYQNYVDRDGKEAPIVIQPDLDTVNTSLV